MEQCFCIIKPDGVKRKLIGNIITRIENKGFEICQMRMLTLSKQECESLYYLHKSKEFYNSLINFMTSGLSIIMVIKGINIIRSMRKICGETDPTYALPGTIRGDLGYNTSDKVLTNIIHCSDSKDAAKYEIELFF